ncbi:hypothetical protein [Stieleria neptunia]|uniref:hypothetical protein n=1 Tax=Stieleria neptunia TaxID=2527979 RepID=UPI0018D1F70D|nr:hypothetical protein [Stieleria neptunia]
MIPLNDFIVGKTIIDVQLTARVRTPEPREISTYHFTIEHPNDASDERAKNDRHTTNDGGSTKRVLHLDLCSSGAKVAVSCYLTETGDGVTGFTGLKHGILPPQPTYNAADLVIQQYADRVDKLFLPFTLRFQIDSLVNWRSSF